VSTLEYTLVADGSSDRALLPILSWLLRSLGVSSGIDPKLADFRFLHKPPRSLRDRVRQSIAYYPCHLLFVHRDAETEPREARVDEIRRAVEEVCRDLDSVAPAVCVVPVRMMEAWLLADEAAIREAADNPQGRHPIDLPNLGRLEDLPDPKQVLHDLLRTASGYTGRRRRNMNTHARVLRVSERITDYSRLRQLPAFRALEQDLCDVVTARGWVQE
jgi:hypothetical protein